MGVIRSGYNVSHSTFVSFLLLILSSSNVFDIFSHTSFSYRLARNYVIGIGNRKNKRGKTEKLMIVFLFLIEYQMVK